MSRRAHLPASLAALLLLGMAAAGASPAQIVLEGRVLDDESEIPLAGARVYLLNRYSKLVKHTVTDDSGRFRFDGADRGWYRLEVSAVGYRRMVGPPLWWTVDHEYTEFEIRLTPHAVLLAPVEIVALSPISRSPIFENLDFRRTRGFGIQISRREIEERNPARLTDMLLEIPGVYSSRTGSGARGGQLSMGRSLFGPGGGSCPVQIFLDGMLATRDRPGGDIQVDDLVSPLDVEAVEVFRGLSSVPPEFLTPEARCGVIAIWTRRSLP